MTEGPSALSGPDNTALIEKRLIRRRFLESVSLVLAILVLIGLPISLSRIPRTGLHPNHIAHSIAGVLFLIAFYFRKRLKDQWLTFWNILILSVLSLAAFLQYGLVSAGFFFASAAIFVSTVSLGLRGGLISISGYGVITFIIGYLWISGHLVFPVDVAEYILQPTVWLALGVAFLITMAIFIVSASGFFNGLTELVDTIDNQKRKIEERTAELTRTNEELEAALKNIKTLTGLLPICSNCKKIRDDQGYWQQLEQFVQEHSQALFTHGLCPDCVSELYPEIADHVLGKMKKN
ncbi:MAG: hypothetical protein KKB20_02570 [Proteobacteria bacterium]|nr:hypothetical protein [Pseudomonadota bacterium]